MSLVIIFIIMVLVYNLILHICSKREDKKKTLSKIGLDINNDGKIDEKDLTIAKAKLRENARNLLDIKHEIDKRID